MNSKIKRKTLLLTVILVSIGFIVIKLAIDFTEEVGRTKPGGPFQSSLSIGESKKDKVWLGNYTSAKFQYSSVYKKQTFEFSDV